VYTGRKQALSCVHCLTRCICVSRTPTLIEKQYRYLCKGCGLTLAYVSNPFSDATSNKYLYLIDGAFSLTNTGKTKQQLEAEQKEAEIPIVIPIFNVQRTTHAAAAAASSTPVAASTSSAAPAAASSSAAAASSTTSTEPAAASSNP
jgi:hypothetical protein